MAQISTQSSSEQFPFLTCFFSQRGWQKRADGSLLLTLFTVAVLRGDSSVGGTVYFEQAPGDAETVIKYKIQGNDPSAERGMHIHQFGDNTNGCTSAGPHCMFPSSSSSTASLPSPSLFPPPPYIYNARKYISQGRETEERMLTRGFIWWYHPPTVNPFSKTHGAPGDQERHVGDLGNFRTDSNGNAEGTIRDKQVQLIGENSVLGVCEQLQPFPPPLSPLPSLFLPYLWIWLTPFFLNFFPLEKDLAK